MEVSSSSSEDLSPDVDFEAALEERMQEMVTACQNLFASATQNIKDAQARYKKDYDKKRNQTEVT